MALKLNAYLDDPESDEGGKHLIDARRLLRVGEVDVPELRHFLNEHPRLAAELERALAAPPPRGRVR